jgi:O-antigen/teichoic acid export membrane protein
MEHVGKKLVSNTIYLFLDWFVLTSTGFVYWIIAGKTLLPEEYGIVSTSINLAIVLGSLALLGIDAATWKLIPEYLEKKEKKKIVALTRFSFKFVVITNVLLAIILTAISFNIAPFLKVTVPVIWMIALVTVIYSISNQTWSVVYGFQNMKKLFTTDIYSQITRVTVSAILIFIGFSYFGPIIGVFLSFLLVVILRLPSVHFKGQAEEINRRHILFEYAFPAFIAGLAWILFINGQYVLLTILKNPEVTGIFTIAMIITSVIAAVPAVMTNALLPITSQLSVGKNAKKKQSHLLNLVFRYSLFVTLPLAIFFVIFSRQLILLFSRSEYLESTQLFPILALAAIIYGSGNIFLNNLYALGKPKLKRNIVITTTVIFLLMAIPLISMFSALGLSIAYLLSVSILTTLSIFFTHKHLKINFQWSSFGKIFVASLIFISILYFITSFVSGLLYGVILTLIAGLIYLFILIPMKFYIREDVRILETLGEQSPIFKKQFGQLSKLLSKFV